LALDNPALLLEWQKSYDRAAPMQGGLALLTALLGFLAAWQLRDWRLLAGALLILANWPYTLLVIRPTNMVLHAVDDAAASQSTRTLIEWWGLLHSVRSLFGAAATLAYFWAMN
jgi:hypothetical protein